MRLRKLLLAVAVANFCVGALRAAENQSANVRIEPDELLKNMTESRRAIVNVRTKCVWHSRELGVVSSQAQDFFWDDLGRRRIVTRLVPRDGETPSPDKDRDCVTDTTYDGEIVALCKSYPHLNRVGQDPDSSEEKTLGYYPVIIGDAASSIQSHLEAERNPFEYLRNAVFPAMRDAIKRRKLSVSEVDTDGVVRAEITNEHIGSNGIARSVIDISPEYQWQVTSMKGYSPKGDCINSISFQYRQQADGLWVPTEGQHLIWSPESPPPASEPVIDWRCEIQEVSFNDSAFDSDVFKITLKPDAAVSDTRYNITYRVGDQEANTARIEGYVADAISKLAQNKRHGPDLTDAPSTTRNRLVITLNVILLIVCGVFYAVSVARKKGNA